MKNKKRKLKEKLNKAKKGKGFALLIPFKGILRKALEKKRIKNDGSIKDIAVKFYEHIVKKDFETENAFLSYEDAVDNLTDVAIDAIVKAIISFIKNVRKKKSEGKELTPIEKGIFEGTEKIEKKLKEEVKEEAEQKVGALVLNPKTLIIVGVILFITLTFLFSKK